MDIVTYALAKKMASSVASGITEVQTDGTNIRFKTAKGEWFTVRLNSVEDATISGTGHLIIELTDGTTIDAGVLPAGTMDTALSSTSENGVQNKVVTAALNGKQNVLTAGTGVTIDTTDPANPEISANVDYTNLVNKPTKLSDFTNDEGFIDNTVNNLANYYLKTETYTRIQAAIDTAKEYTNNQLGKAVKPAYKVVASTSEVTETGYFYLISNGTNYDMYVLSADGSVVSLGTSDVDLSGYAKTSDLEADYLKKTDAASTYATITALNDFLEKTDADSKYATITTVDEKVDKASIITAKDNSATDDQVYSAKAINTELDGVVKKTDIVTTIDNTVTDKQIASARAILRSKSAIHMGESVNPENYDVGAWFAEGQGSTLLSTSYGHPCSEWHISYVVTGYKANDSQGYKIIFAIAMSGNCYVKVQQWDKWTKWINIGTTSVADVPWTVVTTTNTKISGGYIKYRVKNGICFVSVGGVTSSATRGQTISSSLPKAEDTVIYGGQLSGSGDGENNGYMFISNRNTLIMNIKNANVALYGSFSYPVAES